MGLITVSLSAAVLCFANHCYPALVGKTTPVGTFEIHRVLTDAPGYGGEFLQFKEEKTDVFAIHQVYLLNPKQHRASRIESNDPKVRVITDGCINVEPWVYVKLKGATEVRITR